jgi:adenylate kinase family enzyme
MFQHQSLCYAVEQLSGSQVKKLIITGANGVGKSHFASKLASARPEVPVISFDAIKLKKYWQQRPRAEIDIALTGELEKEAWILEGGPSLLAQAVEKADALVWLDPPEHVRAWQLATRPWKHLGRTRPELPSGNIDWPWQQYKFALRSLKNRSRFRTYISEVFSRADGLQKWRCRNASDRSAFVTYWGKAQD